MSEYIKYYSILYAVGLIYMLLIVPTLQLPSTWDTSNRLPTQNAESESMHLQNKLMNVEFSCVLTLRFVSGRRKLYSFMFVVSIWCCAYGKEGSEVFLHFFNLNQTAWYWQWNLWSSIYLDFRFSYQISLNEEPVHLSLSNFKIFLQLYIEQFFHFLRVSISLRL